MKTIVKLAERIDTAKINDEMLAKKDFSFPLDKEEFLCLRIMFKHVYFYYNDKDHHETEEKRRKERELEKKRKKKETK